MHAYNRGIVIPDLPSPPETLNWDMNVDSDFQRRWWHRCEVIGEGVWGRRVRLFYHIFYGEGYVIRPREKYQREGDGRPFAGGWSLSLYYSVVGTWSGALIHNSSRKV